MGAPINSFFINMGQSLIRNILNSAIGKSTPDQLYECITNDISLWGEGSDSIKASCGKLPPFILNQAEALIKSMYEFNDQGIYGLVREWLNTDQPVLYSTLINTPYGDAWLDAQINEILVGLNVNVGE